VRDSPDYSKINYIIFDWDGTIVDSMSVYTKAFSTVLSRKFGISENASSQYYKNSAGKTLSVEFVQAISRFADKRIRKTEQLEKEFWKILEGDLNANLIEGAKETLQGLKVKNRKISIWSGSKEEVIKSQIIKLGIDDLIDFCIGTKSGPNQTTKGPDFFKIIADYFKINVKDLRNQAIVVGDGPGDMEAAKKCGVFAIGVLKTTSKENLEKAGADLIIEKISDLSILI